jgi:hypothetical protein
LLTRIAVTESARGDEILTAFLQLEAAIHSIHPDHNASPNSVIKRGKKRETMKITYLILIAGLSTGLAISAQPVMAQQGQHRSGQQFNQHAQRERERERSRTNGNVREREREREREKPNGVVVEQRQEQRTNAEGQTQTRSQERTKQPHP